MYDKYAELFLTNKIFVIDIERQNGMDSADVGIVEKSLDFPSLQGIKKFAFWQYL